MPTLLAGHLRSPGGDTAFLHDRAELSFESAARLCVTGGMRNTPAHLQADAARRRVAAGFTLIELLAIIAVLAALVMPAYASVKRKGQQTASINNLRQWGAA